MKKTLSIMLILALLCTSFVAFAANNDIKGHWAEEIIVKWSDSEKINGYEDGTFKPDNKITRGEFAKILSTVLKQPNGVEEEKHEFDDVTSEDWFYTYVENLLSLDVVAPAQNFNPNNFITREDVMTMVGRAFYLQSTDHAIVEKFTDYKDISEYSLDYVSALVEAKYVGGYEDNTIRPKANITRAESIKILDGLNLVHNKNSLEGIMDRTYSGVKTEMPRLAITEITPENSEYYLGIKNMEFVRGIASEPLMSSQAHSVCLVEVKDGSDIPAIKEQIRTSVNPRKWVCVGVEPEDVIVENIGNIILLVMDQFAPTEIRDSFLALDLKDKIKADENKLINTDGYYMDFIGEIRPEAVENFAKKVDAISEQYLKDSNSIFYSVVPSKSYFVNDRLETPFDYDKMDTILKENIKSAKYINLMDTLALTDFYVTDPHWKQDNLQKVVNRLGESLGFSIDISKNTVNTVENFIGHHGLNKENFPSEKLNYLTSAQIDNSVVTNFEDKNFNKVYNPDKLTTKSPYDFFLSGPTPLTTIKNGQAPEEKKLVIFRDSCTSSLAPLLIEGYNEITLVDIRYMATPLLGDYVDFSGKDVLFLYNEQIINNSEMLK